MPFLSSHCGKKTSVEDCLEVDDDGQRNSPENVGVGLVGSVYAQINLEDAPAVIRTSFWRAFVKTKLGDFEGALANAAEFIKVGNDKPFGLQERGVLKRLMGDLPGALANLDEGLKLRSNDYEMLKHRRLLKFLLKDKDGARADAEWALTVKPPQVGAYSYGRGSVKLGISSVEFLDYKLE